MADTLMTESAELYVQRLEEKLLIAETSLREKENQVQTMKIEQKAYANEIEEMESRHNKEVKTLQAEGQKAGL